MAVFQTKSTFGGYFTAIWFCDIKNSEKSEDIHADIGLGLFQL